MDITVTSIFVSSLLAILLLPRFIYFAIVNQRRYPKQLFAKPYLFIFILNFLLAIALVIVSLFYSSSFYSLGLFFVWLFIVLTMLCLALLVLSVFVMNGYNPHFQFKKMLLPMPIYFIEVVGIVSTSLLTMNYYLLIPGCVYALTSFIWNYKGYLLTNKD